MTKDEALNAWKAALDTYLSVHRNSPELVSWRECFSHWWRARSAKPEEATQTTTTGDGIPYEYISSTSTAPDSFFGRVASAGGAKDTEK